MQLIIFYDTLFYIHHVQVVDQKFSSRAEYYTSFTFGFKEKEISLDIPSDGIELDNGWKIFPLSQPTVMFLI